MVTDAEMEAMSLMELRQYARGGDEMQAYYFNKLARAAELLEWGKNECEPALSDFPDAAEEWLKAWRA